MDRLLPGPVLKYFCFCHVLSKHEAPSVKLPEAAEGSRCIRGVGELKRTRRARVLGSEVRCQVLSSWAGSRPCECSI